jgi:phosphohistidine phosphatase
MVREGMKRLHLLRHAKAVAKDEARDFDRILAPHGRDAMGRVSHHLAEHHRGIDLALVSPAARTRETWQLARMPGVTTRFEDRIYEASAETLLAVIRDADETAGSAILVGHNPGLQDLARRLVGFGDRHASVRRLEEFPTGSLATFDLAVESWREADFGTARLLEFVTPRSLGGPAD